MCVCTGVFQDMQHRGLRVEGVGRGEESGQGVRTYLSYLCSCEAALHMRLHLFMCDYVHRCAVCNVFVCVCRYSLGVEEARGQYVRCYRRVQTATQTPGIKLWR